MQQVPESLPQQELIDQSDQQPITAPGPDSAETSPIDTAVGLPGDEVLPAEIDTTEPGVVAEAEQQPADEPEPAAEPAVDITQTAPSSTAADPDPVAVVTPPPPVIVAPVIAQTQTRPVPVPTVAGQNPTEEELEAIVSAWIMAWQNKDLGSYFTFYHTDFAPLYQPTRASWRNNRASSISRPATITIETEPLVVASADDLGVRVQFWMNYQAPNYGDRTLKELVIGRDVDGQFRILQEYNRQVTGLPRALTPANQQIAAIPAASSAVSIPPSAVSQGGASVTRTVIAAPVTLLGRVPNNSDPSANSGLSPDEIGGINSFVTGWLTAWQNQDIAAYFGHYQSGFSPAGKTRTQWEQERITRITQPMAIQMSMEDMRILSYNPLRTAVNFSLEYHSSYYADRTLKELVLEQSTTGGWLISSEKNKSVELLPLSRLVGVREVAGLLPLAAPGKL